eukprot:c53438_g1_i1.p1 GENE.c53438_g1_i1~~c53438_g1_i1.p1  ORF type:complete len:308 (+),score=55.83 c53438_g1_i1:50-925(+)
MSPRIVTILRGLVSPWLMFSGDWLIPRLSKWMAARYHSTGDGDHFSTASTDLTVRLVPASSFTSHGGTTRRVATSTNLILVAQLINSIVAPVMSELILHNKCLGFVTEEFWQPCQDSNTTFTINVTLSRARFALPEVRVLERGEVCRSHFDAELCSREVIASIAILSVSKVAIQTLVVLLRALLLATTVKPLSHNNIWRRFEIWLVNVATPDDETVTRSIVSLLILALALGGAAPLIWPMVLFCVYSTMLLWKSSGQPCTYDAATPAGVSVMWLGIVVQVGFGLWFALANA